MAGGMRTLLDLRHGIYNQAGLTDWGTGPSAKAPFRLHFLMVPIASTSPGFPTKLSRKQEDNEHHRALVSQRKGSAFLQGSKKPRGEALMWAAGMHNPKASYVVS